MRIELKLSLRVTRDRDETIDPPHVDETGATTEISQQPQYVGFAVPDEH